LVTTKYNPARTWTPDNVVGIGGAYMCIYGMEGPGGYQLFGRTCQMWNTYRATEAFKDGEPWLLRFFDQIKFYPVSAEELIEFRDRFLEGKAPVSVEHTTFRLKDYLAFLDGNADSIAAFKARQQAAFDGERTRWQYLDQQGAGGVEHAGDTADLDAELPDGAVAVESPVPGSVWKILVEPGSKVEQGEALIIVESMKMEMAVSAPSRGFVREVRCAEGRPVQIGQPLVILSEHAV
jgi:urea carboxylase